MGLLSEKKLRNAFIPKLCQMLSRSEIKMKKSSIIAIAIASIILVSSLSLAVNFAAAMPSMELTGNRPLQKTWVRLNGVINTWGNRTC